ncbi:MAG: hypothetical protein K8H90_08580, partial [Thermoanaerobaculia bacterium]|nr:hypothetical protein [Thermoanaerobaculia bacterium]
ETNTPDPATYEEAKPHLLPGLRHPVVFKAMALVEGAGFDPGEAMPCRPLGPNLAVYLFVDQAHSMRYVVQTALDRWGVTFDDAFEQALTNLRERSRAPLAQLGRGVAVSTWSDSYDSARLLLSEVLAQIEAPGEPVAFAPGHNTLILTGDRDEDSLSAALRLARESWENEPRPVSVLPVVRRGSRWQELVLPRGHGCFELLRELRVCEAAQLYEEQTPALQSWYERRGEDVYVARLMASKHTETGHFNSVAVWSKGVDTLLPQAEQIAFYDPDEGEKGKTLAMVDSDLVESRLETHLERTDHVPKRFRVRTFPTLEAIEQLRLLQERRAGAGAAAGRS